MNVLKRNNPGMNGDVYVGVDVMKFVCALLIVFLHTYNYDLGQCGDWTRVNLSSVGVPFFFIVSGFLYAKGLKRNANKKEYFLHYLKRVFYMYLFWSVLTLPVAWMNVGIAHSDYSLAFKVIYIVRCFIFSGTLGIYWYLLALVYSCIVIFYALKWNKLFLLYLISFIFFVVGVLYDGGLIKGTFVGKFIHVVVGSENNFLNVGLFYMCIGLFFQEKGFVMNRYVTVFLLILSIVLSTILNEMSPYRFMKAPIAVFLFMLSIQYGFSMFKRSSVTLRKWSTAIYLGHFPFVLLFDYYLKRGTWIDFSLAILFSLVLFYVLSYICPKSFLKHVYG